MVELEGGRWLAEQGGEYVRESSSTRALENPR